MAQLKTTSITGTLSTTGDTTIGGKLTAASLAITGTIATIASSKIITAAAFSYNSTTGILSITTS